MNPSNIKIGRFNLYHIIGAVMAVLIAIWLVSSAFGVRKDRANYESSLNAQFTNTANSLGKCETQIAEAIGIAREAAKEFRENIKTAAGAVATLFNGGNPTATRGQLSGILFPIMVKIYPDQNAMLRQFENVYRVAISCRESFFNEQKRMADIARQYQSWINGDQGAAVWGLVMDIPSRHLKFEIGDSTWRGQDALEKALKPLTTADAQREFETSTLNPVITSPVDTEPSPTTSGPTGPTSTESK